MSLGLLLDTHAVLWLAKGILSESTAETLSRAAGQRNLFVSHISLWELGVALQKERTQLRPDLSGLSPAIWLRRTCREFAIRQLPITAQVAAEAASIPIALGYGDPGDCFLVATARVKDLALVTHDDRIIAFARRRPDYLRVVRI